MAQHLLHVGYPKAGSTFLQNWFERHPQLKFKKGGLGGFGNVFEVARPLDRDYKYFVTSFEGLTMPDESSGSVHLRYSGKVEVKELDLIKTRQAEVCSVLNGLYPQSRVIIVTRGFEGILFSSYSQSVRMGAVLDFIGMCAELAQRLRHDEQHYFDYDYFISLYKLTFGKDNVIVLPYELLRDDQNRFLETLEERLELEHVEMPPIRVNVSLSPQELYWYPRISRRVANAASLLGSRAFRKIYTGYVRKTLFNKFRIPIKLLARTNPRYQVTKSELPREILELCRGRATLLQDDPLYAAYAADYLWD